MIPFLRSIARGPVRHIHRFMTDANYRKWSFLETKYKFYPRYKEFKTEILGHKFIAPDAASFRSSYKDIFLKEIYKFQGKNNQPVIVDLGANVGLSIIYFKHLYSEAEIVALEADPGIFRYLQRNIAERSFSNVELVNKAAWRENTSLNFHSTGDDGGRLVSAGDSSSVVVEAMDITPLLNKKIDFLKIDIEGAEYEVLNACKDQLRNVDNIALEYHSEANNEQYLDEILHILRRSGFRVHVHPVHTSSHPFLAVEVENGFDLQLDIFAWRNDEE